MAGKAFVGTAWAAVLPSFDNFGKTVKDTVTKEVGAAGTAAGKQAGTDTGNGFMGTFKAILAADIVKGVVNKAFSGVKTVIDGVFQGGLARAIKLDEATAQFKALGYESGNAMKDLDKVMASVKGSVKDTRFSLDEAAGSAIGFLAAGIKEGPKLERAMSMVADAAGLTGKNFADLAPAFQEAARQGRVTGQVLRQLEDNNVPVTKALMDSMGKTAEEIRKMASTGQISFEDLDKAMDQSFGGFAKKTDSFTSSLANTKSALARFGALFMGPAISAAKPVLDAVRGAISDLEEPAGKIAAVVGEKLAGAAEKLVGWIGQAKDIILDLIAGKPLTEAFGPIGEFVGPIASVASALSPVKIALDILKGILPDVGDAFRRIKDAVQPVIPKFADLAKDLLPKLVDAGAGIATSLLPAVADLAEKLGPTIAHLIDIAGPILGAVIDAVGAVSQVVGEAIGWLVDHENVLLGVGVGITAILVPAFFSWAAGAWSAAAGTIAAAAPIVALVAAIALLVAGILWLVDNWDTVVAWIKKVWQKACDLAVVIFQSVADFFITIGTTIAGFFTKLWEDITSALTTAWEAVRDFFTRLWDGITSGLQNAWNGIKNFVTGLWDGIRSTASTVWDGIKNAVMTPIDALRDLLQRVWDGISNAASNMANGIKDFFSTTFGSIAGIIKAPINAVIGLINSAIGGLNSISVSIPSWVPKYGGQRFGIQIPYIPYLAKGATILPRAGGTLAVLAEAGRAESVVDTAGMNKMILQMQARLAQQNSDPRIDRLVELLIQIVALLSRLAAGPDNQMSREQIAQAISDLLLPKQNRGHADLAVLAGRGLPV